MSVFMGATTKPFQFVEVIGIGSLGLGGAGLVAGIVMRSWPLGVLSTSLALWGFSVTPDHGNGWRIPCARMN